MMAGLVAHIFCALAILQSGALKIENEKAFIIGSCYPDIRYLGVIDRATTHYNNVRWEDIVAASSDFQKGVLLHNLVDEVRIAQLEKPHATRLPSLPIMRSQIMKFFEDSLLYHQVADWQKILHYFDDIYPEERFQGIADTALTTWHQFIKAYCRQQPSALSTHAIINQFPPLRRRIPLGIPSLISKLYFGIALKSFNKPALVNAMRQFYTNAVSLITHNAHLGYQTAGAMG
jgi:hypothetical protein